MTRKVFLAMAGIALMAGMVHAAQSQATTTVVRGGVRPQAPAPGTALAFEVASVKPNTSGDGRGMLGMQPGGRFTATNVALRMLIREAYQLQDFQLIGGPAWIASDRFDVVAKAKGDLPPTPMGTVGPGQLMIRTLLAERFKLKVRNETRELPIYELVLARSDGKLGPQLRSSAADCAAAGRSGGAPPAPLQPGERPKCGMRIGLGQMRGGGLPLSQLATILSQSLGRVVVDRTRLTGTFDLDLTWTPDQLPPGSSPPGAPLPPSVASNGPSIFTALLEQLGLKLASTKGPVDVVVIDSVERPAPD